MKQYVGLGLWVVLCMISRPVFALEPLKASHFTLNNGLRVEVLYQPKTPIVTHMLWFDAGSRDEASGKSGVAHYLEHMMFKGTKKFPAGKYESIIERLGGQQNAFTTNDYTAYYATVAREKLPKVMELESDRIQHLAPAQDSYAGELQVVMEERRMRTDNDPSARLGEVLQARLFAPHPYGIPVIGWMHEVAKLTPKDVMTFYHHYYQPYNAVLLLVGDITPQDAKLLAQRYYGGWRITAHPMKRKWSSPQPLKTYMPLALKDNNVSQPQWQRLYAAPSLGYGNKNQVFPLIVLTHMLCGSEAGKLYQELVVKQKIATSLSCSYNAFMRGSGSLEFSMIPAKNISLSKAAKALDAALLHEIEGEVDIQAFARAKNSLKVETIYARDSISGMAFVYGQLMMLALGADFFNGWADAIMKVQWSQVQSAAREVIISGHSVTGWVLPDGSKPKTGNTSSANLGMGQHVR